MIVGRILVKSRAFRTFRITCTLYGVRMYTFILKNVGTACLAADCLILIYLFSEAQCDPKFTFQ